MMKAAIVYDKFKPRHLEMLRREHPDVRFDLYGGAKAFPAERAGEYEILIGGIPPALLKRATRLRLLQLGSAGVDGYADEALYAGPVILANASGAYGLAISECLVGMHLCLQKKFLLYRDQMKRHLWKDGGAVTSIYQSTVVVLGTGDIGSAYARCVRPFGPYLIGVRRREGQVPEFDRVVTLEELDQVLPLADAAVCALPGTAATYRLLDRRRIGLMKEGALVLNVGRGTAIDTEALCDALESGHLGGAALDVTDPEPLPAGHRLWDLPNVLITPHSTGMDHLITTVDNIARIASDNIGHLMRGEPIPQRVDMREGY